DVDPAVRVLLAELAGHRGLRKVRIEDDNPRVQRAQLNEGCAIGFAGRRSRRQLGQALGEHHGRCPGGRLRANGRWWSRLGILSKASAGLWPIMQTHEAYARPRPAERR